MFTGEAIGPEQLNPLESPEFFVRQQYLDFLGREPEQAGLDFWAFVSYPRESPMTVALRQYLAGSVSRKSNLSICCPGFVCIGSATPLAQFRHCSYSPSWTMRL